MFLQFLQVHLRLLLPLDDPAADMGELNAY
jgi:hypothetical protein